MAADPFAGYAPSQAADPFAGYSPPPQPSAPVSPPAPDLGSTMLWNKPANVSTGDFLLAHLANLKTPFQGAGQAADDYARAVTDAATFGGADRLAAYMGGTDLADERAKTAASHARLGLMDYPASAIGYAAVPGTGASGIAGKLGGGVMGTALEGAAAGGLSGAGHGDGYFDTALGAAAGAAGGGVLGGATKYVAGPLATLGANAYGKATGLLSDPADVTANALAARTKAYDALKDTPLDIGDTRQALQGVRDTVEKMDPTGGFQKNAPRSMAILDNLQDHVANNNSVSAHDLVALGLDKLRNIPDTAAAGGENELKGPIQTGLQNFLESGPAAGQLADAQDAHKHFYANAKALQDWSQSLKGFGQSPAGGAQALAEKFYPDPTSKQYQALANIAQTAGGGGQSAYNLMHLIDPLLAAGGAAVGGPGGAMAGEMAGHLAKPTLGAALAGLQRGATQRAIGGAYPALTGADPSLWSPDFSPAARALMFGKAASSGY